MTRAQFLSQLKDGLSGLRPAEISDIMADYEAHFADAAAAGRSEAEVAAAMGDPVRLAKELRAEMRLKAWEADRSPKNFLDAGMALFGLLALDVLILLPLFFVFLIVLAALVFALWIVASVGLGLAGGILHGGIGGWAEGLAGLGIFSTALGVGALMLLLLGGGMRLLARYARLHYRLLNKPLDGQGDKQ